MRRRIYHSFCFITLAALIFSTAASLTLYYRFYSQQSRESLSAQCRSLAAGAEASGDPLAFVRSLEISQKSLRITFLSLDGTVLYDSKADAEELPNHGQRPEVVEALKSGFGEEYRYSATLGEGTYYCAVRPEGADWVLRLSSNSQSILSVFLQILPVDLLSCLVLFGASLFLAQRVTNRIVDPMLAAADHLDQIHDDGIYSELTPFLEKIHRQNSTIRHQLETIRLEKETITVILENMREGLVLLDGEKRVLSVNQSALEFLDPPVRPQDGQSVLQLTRLPALIAAVDAAVVGEASSGLLPMERDDAPLTCRYFANPVLREGKLSGVILLLLDVTEQVRTQQIREEFTANVSHELKTPLTTISGFAELMEQGMVADPKEIASFSAAIHKEAGRLLLLIDDIIRLSRIEEEKVPLQDPVNLLALAQSSAQRLASHAEKADVTVMVQGDPVTILGNETMLREVVDNLCDNAIKYNRPGGSVVITVGQRVNTACLEVSDTGIGIPAASRDRVFERFYRVDKSRSKQTGGTGLGLSIVKHVVERHHGRIVLQSEEGVGTTIRVSLPISVSHSQG